jgi:hypothetical protein
MILDDMSSLNNTRKIPLKKTKFRIKFIIFDTNETSGFLRLTRMFRGFQPKLPLNNWKFRLIFQNGMLFITVCLR